MSKIVDIDEKLMEKNPTNIEWAKLSEQISNYLPINSIPSNVIDYYCRVFIYEKKHEWDWMDKVDCYLGLPEYIEKEEDLNNIDYQTFPLSLVYNIIQQTMNNVRFSLRYASSFDNEIYFLHFDYLTFSDHLSAFEKGMETNFEKWVGKVTLKWKSLVKKIRDKPYKYSDLRLQTQLNHYFQTTYRYNLKQSTFNVLIKEYFDYSIGQDYGIWEHYKKRGEFEDIVDGINLFDIPTLYETLNDEDNSKNTDFKVLFPNINQFALELNQFHLMTNIQFESDPTNHVIERELDFMNQLISNTNKRLLRKWKFEIETSSDLKKEFDN